MKGLAELAVCGDCLVCLGRDRVRKLVIGRIRWRREVLIDAKLATELTERKLAQKPEHRQADSLVVSTRAGEPISASNFLAREFYPALEAAKLPRVVFHSLRHTATTILASSNTPGGKRS